MSEIGLSPISKNDQMHSALRDHFLRLVSEATQTTNKLDRFPGTMPITLSRRHLQMVARSDYVCLEKSDGTRYMLLAVTDFVVLIDRQMRFYVIDPNPAIRNKGFIAPQDNTLLDGELTFNIMTNQWDYLIYDAIVIDGDLRVAQMGFRDRMEVAAVFVAAPRLWAPFTAGLLRIRIKDYYEKHQIRNLFSKIRKDPHGKYLYVNNDRRDGVLCNENDGVIFSPVGMPYQVRNCPALLKWKPPELNSIDFALQLEQTIDPKRNNQPSVKCYIAYQGERGPVRMREVYFPSKLRRQFAANFHAYHNSIVELSYDKAAGEWKYLRQRKDKANANFSSTVIDTMETITESLEKEELVRYLEKYSSPSPADQKQIIEQMAKNIEDCTFRDDYFDDDNPDYLVATPISMVPVPQVSVPPGKRQNRQRRNQGDGRHRLANGGSHANQGTDPDQSVPQGAGRAAMEYSEDV